MTYEQKLCGMAALSTAGAVLGIVKGVAVVPSSEAVPPAGGNDGERLRSGNAYLLVHDFR